MEGRSGIKILAEASTNLGLDYFLFLLSHAGMKMMEALTCASWMDFSVWIAQQTLQFPCHAGSRTPAVDIAPFENLLWLP